MATNAQIPEEHSGPSQAQRVALARAGVAASQGKAVEMVEALYQSHVLDGLVRKLTANWSALSADDIREIVAEAVAGLYRKVAQGGRVTHAAAYLYRVTLCRACDLHAARKISPVTDPAVVTIQSDAAVPWRGSGNSNPAEGAGFDREEALPRALAAARRLLPQLGQENLRKVMAYILDAVEAGREEVSNPEIAEALSLTPDSVRQSRFRGFQRLARLAKDDRLVREDFAVLSAAGEDEAGTGEPED